VGGQSKHPIKKGESFRIFVDGLWARGIKKEEAGIDLWLKEIAPSDELRKWFGHDPHKWNQFQERYFKELDNKKELVELILQKLRSGASVFLLYGAKDEKFNNAVALKEYLVKKLAK
jgi:uncharacterized protein YeaO (DUF488 family)